nr:hypothetical protein [Tanacetum cinerariifolium]
MPTKRVFQVLRSIDSEEEPLGEGSLAAPWKKKARKNGEHTGLKSEGTISVTQIHQAIPKPLNETNESPPKDARNTEHLVFPDAHSFHYVHDEDNDEDADQHRRTYESLGRSILSQAELLKRHEKLNREHVELYNCIEVQMGELSHLRDDYRREMQKTGELLKDMEKNRDNWRQIASDQVERINKLEEDIEPKSKKLSDAEDLGRKEDEILAMLTNTINLDIEGSKVWKDKRRELFTMQYPYVQKIADSYRLSVDASIKVSPDVPHPAIDDDARPSVKNNDDGSAKLASPKVHLNGTSATAPPKITT